MFYPSTYQEILDDVKNGKYGKEMKKLVDETELATVDASFRTYRCKKCGRIESSPRLDLYKPNNIESAKKTVIENRTTSEPKFENTVDGLGCDDSNRDKREGDYVLLKRYKHTCPTCKETMDEVGEKATEEMHCPKCGEKYKDISYFFWD